MHLLPLSLGRLAEHADRRATTAKFALDAVFLRLNSDNTFEAVVSDARCLVRVTGPCIAPASDFPLFPELADAPDDGTSALIPAEVWKRVFAWGRKLTTRREVTNPACRGVAVRIGASETALGVTDERSPWSDAAAHISGQFVPYEQVIAATLGKPVTDRFTVDPLLLSDLLRTAAEFGPDKSALRVEIEARGPRQPLVVRAGQPGGVEFFGLLMPLLPDTPPPPPPAR